jgi:hypothetical protein
VESLAKKKFTLTPRYQHKPIYHKKEEIHHKNHHILLGTIHRKGRRFWITLPNNHFTEFFRPKDHLTEHRLTECHLIESSFDRIAV